MQLAKHSFSFMTWGQTFLLHTSLCCLLVTVSRYVNIHKANYIAVRVTELAVILVFLNFLKPWLAGISANAQDSSSNLTMMESCLTTSFRLNFMSKVVCTRHQRRVSHYCCNRVVLLFLFLNSGILQGHVKALQAGASPTLCRIDDWYESYI